MDHVESEQHRNTEPISLDCEPLQTIDLCRIGDKEQ